MRQRDCAANNAGLRSVPVAGRDDHWMGDRWSACLRSAEYRPYLPSFCAIKAHEVTVHLGRDETSTQRHRAKKNQFLN